MRAEVKVTSSNWAQAKLIQSIGDLTRKKVYVGIPAAKAARNRRQKRQPINNAELMYIHTNGSLLKHIPPRPVIEPAIQDPVNLEQIADEFKLAGVAALDGKPELVTRQLNLAGTVAENAARGWFTNPKNGWAPNAPSTIRRKGSSRPLIDTGQLRKAITHVVSEE